MRIETGHSGCSDDIIKAHAQSLREYTLELKKARNDETYATPLTALHAPFDSRAIEQAISIADSLRAGLRTVVLVGIGGSDLGVRAIYDAFFFRDRFSTESSNPKLVCFDTIEPGVLEHCQTIFSQHSTPEEVVLVVISKSGTTIETIVNANMVFSAFANTFGKGAAIKQTLYIGDDNERFAALSDYGMRCIAMPKAVGGRYSVFSAVGLVPLALLGFDIQQFTDGAKNAIDASLPAEGYGPASVLSSILFESYTMGNVIHELYFFHPELSTLGKWYRQLLAESLGKEREDGTRVGITPSVCIGSTDLHSMGQLAFGGPRNRITTFVTAPTAWESFNKKVEADSPFFLSLLEEKRPADIIRAIYGGVMNAYKTERLPFIVNELSGMSERELGAWMALQMTTVVYAAKLFEIDACNQPAVERYKEEARAILRS